MMEAKLDDDAMLLRRNVCAIKTHNALELPILVLNAHFHPVQVTSVRRGIVLLYGGTARALDDGGELHDFHAWQNLPVRSHDDFIPTVQGSVRVPRVIHLRKYDRIRMPTIPLTRKNVMLRDGYQCQYCSKNGTPSDLNIDHIVPRSRGGPSTWENLVTACMRCNLAKGWKTPEEAEMRLLRSPVRPKWTLLAQLLMGMEGLFAEWKPFLRMN